jgi:hypothetical protein
MARLDQDAAGRLLEGAGDRTPREMTVRMFASCEYPTEPGLQIVSTRRPLARKRGGPSVRCHRSR